MDAFFTDLIAALRDIEAVRGCFVLAMLTPSRFNTREWDLQVSASWLDRMPSIRSGREALQAELQPRVTFLDRYLDAIRVQHREDYMVQALVPLFNIKEFGTAYSFTSLEQTLFELDEVIVLVARPALLEQNELKLSA